MRNPKTKNPNLPQSVKDVFPAKQPSNSHSLVPSFRQTIQGTLLFLLRFLEEADLTDLNSIKNNCILTVTGGFGVVDAALSRSLAFLYIFWNRELRAKKNFRRHFWLGSVVENLTSLPQHGGNCFSSYFFRESPLFILSISNLCNCWRKHLLSVVSCIESHKKQDLELIHDYLPEGSSK